MKLRRFLSVFLLLATLSWQFMIPTAYALEPIEVEAKAALLADLDTGAVLFTQNAHDELAPASLTKVMTALLVLEAINRGEMRMNQAITATTTALAGLPDDGSNADPAIVAGETMTVEDLLFCMMVVSANEACNILAEAVSGTVADFVEAMNARAKELGCKDTHFANANGLTSPSHYTSAYDIWLMTQEALKYEDFRFICSATWKNIQPTNKCDHVRALHTTNSLLDGWRYSGYQYSYATGIKTGTTEAAGHCLVGSASKGSRNLVSVILGAETKTSESGGSDIMSFTETVRLFEWGFENFTSKEVLSQDEMIQEVPVALSKETDYVVVHPSYTASTVLPNDVEPDQMTRTVTLYQDVFNAPILTGDKLGTITLSYNGTDYITVPLEAVSDVNADGFLTAKYNLQQFFSKTSVRICLVILILLVAAFTFWWRVFHRQRRYGKARNKRYRQRRYHGRRF